MAADLARARLAEERKLWRKDRPFGFVAKPRTNADGSVNLQHWDCLVPGPEDTPWEGGAYPVELIFPDTFPTKPPKAKFPAGFWHMNVYPDGSVCLSLLNDDAEMGGDWKPSINLKMLLQGIQTLLATPNKYSPANNEAYEVFRKSEAAYLRRVKEQVKKYPPPSE